MPCYTPLTGYVSKSINSNGKYPVVFNINDGWADRKISVPCGQCIGCRLEKSRQWAVRCMHEASLYDNNCFITLTFSNENLKSNSLCKSDFQKFMKRLRKFLGFKIRYFHCGEYGDNFNRPHHHACIFGYDFPDKVLWSDRDGVRIYRSLILEKIWGFGYCTIGDVTFESAAYVARYCLKKVTGENAINHYKDKIPEYITMSRRPGIGLDWLRKFHKDVYPSDKIVVRNNIICKPPKYYDDKYSELDLTKEDLLYKLKFKRKEKALRSPDNSYQRLAQRKVVKQQKAVNLRRGYETTSI